MVDENRVFNNFQNCMTRLISLFQCMRVYPQREALRRRQQEFTKRQKYSFTARHHVYTRAGNKQRLTQEGQIRVQVPIGAISTCAKLTVDWCSDPASNEGKG